MILHIVPCDFGVDEIDRQQAVFLPAMGEAWYWYCEGDWEGTGEMIGWLPNECLGISPNLHLDEAIGWFYHNMGHCSCYGPTENFEKRSTFPTLAALEQSCTEELLVRLAPLLAEVRKAIPTNA